MGGNKYGKKGKGGGKKKKRPASSDELFLLAQQSSAQSAHVRQMREEQNVPEDENERYDIVLFHH